MKRTLLTTAQREILEKLLAERGLIVSTQDVSGLLSYETGESNRVTEVLAESRHSFDFDRLNRYLERANLTTQRICGFLFKLVGIEYAEGLLSRAQQATAAARLTPGSGTYNARWRLYYDADLRARYSHAT